MPYISQNERLKFKDHIETIIGIIVEGAEALYIKGEYFGYFVHRFVKKFVGDPGYTGPAFNSTFFNPSKLKTLANSADSASALLNRADPLSAAVELNYVISTIYSGLLGEAECCLGTTYGLRVYLRGILEKTKVSIESNNSGSQSDATMAFRRHLIVRGVLDEVIDEMYRRHTSVCQDGKLNENGDLWVGGKLG